MCFHYTYILTCCGHFDGTEFDMCANERYRRDCQTKIYETVFLDELCRECRRREEESRRS